MTQNGWNKIYELQQFMKKKLEHWGYNRQAYIEELSTRLDFEKESFAEISDRNIFIVFHYFGFGYTPEIGSLESIGNIFGISRQRVHYLKNRTIEQLKAAQN